MLCFHYLSIGFSYVQRKMSNMWHHCVSAEAQNGQTKHCL